MAILSMFSSFTTPGPSRRPLEMQAGRHSRSLADERRQERAERSCLRRARSVAARDRSKGHPPPSLARVRGTGGVLSCHQCSREQGSEIPRVARSKSRGEDNQAPLHLAALHRGEAVRPIRRPTPFDDVAENEHEVRLPSRSRSTGMAPAVSLTAAEPLGGRV